MLPPFLLRCCVRSLAQLGISEEGKTGDHQSNRDRSMWQPRVRRNGARGLVVQKLTLATRDNDTLVLTKIEGALGLSQRTLKLSDEPGTI